MDGNVEFLNYIHQNAEMGKDTINQLIGISRDEEYKKMLQSQLQEYTMIYDSTDKKLKELNKEAKDINAFSKISTYAMVNLKTLANKSPSHISEMLIQGSTMGIIDLTKKLKEYDDADEEIIALANELLQLEQNNVEECKNYLQWNDFMNSDLIDKAYEISDKYNVILKGHIKICGNVTCILFAHYCKSTLFYYDFFNVLGDILNVNTIASKNLKETKRLIKLHGYKKVWTKGVFSFYGDLRPLAVEAGFGKWSDSGIIENEKYGTDFLITAIFYK